MNTRTAIFILIIVALAAVVFFLRADEPVIETTEAVLGTIVEEVSVTGRVKPVEQVALAFEKGGRVAGLFASVGSRVSTGGLLASLENSDERAGLAEAKAARATQEAALAELIAGSRAEEVAVTESKLLAAESAVIDSRESLLNDIRNAFLKADDAVRNRVDQFMSNPRGDNPQLNFETPNDNAIELARVAVEHTLVAWGSSLAALSLESDLRAEAASADDWLAEIQSFLNMVASAVNGIKTNVGLSQTTIDSWRSDISAARTNVETVRANISTGKESLNANEATRALRENELLLAKAPATDEAIAVQEAKVKEAEARVSRAEAAFTKTLLLAPLGGIVTNIPIRIGEIVTANTIAVALISEDAFEIETFIPEADIVKVSVGDGARVTLDAYGDSVILSAYVSAIDPAETVLEGVSTYKTTLIFGDTDVEIKSGMTANVDIETARKDNVVIIPLKAVQYGAAGTEVDIFSNGLRETVLVQTGIESADGMVEIVSGISDGTAVVTYSEE